MGIAGLFQSVSGLWLKGLAILRTQIILHVHNREYLDIAVRKMPKDRNKCSC